MGTSALQGPSYVFGAMEYLQASAGLALPDYNPDAGPSMSYQGEGVFDVRFFLQKNKLNGFAGVQPGFLQSLGIEVVDAVPSAYGTAKIAAAAHTTNGTAMTLVTTQAAGITPNVPIVPYTGAMNGTPAVVAPLVLDFGFAFAATVAGNTTITVADSTQFTVGMPLVLPGALTTTSALLTWVVSIPTSTTVVLHDAPGVTNAGGTIPVGTGNIWPGAPLSTPNQQYPTAHYPYIAGGPGAFLDPAQSLARGVSITTGTGGSGGNVTVSGWDIYWQPMTEVIAASATGATTVFGKKAFKAIKSVTPAFTDATGTYSVGTSDVFGFNLRARNWERTTAAWAAAFVTGGTGFTAFTTPALGDVRGTFQASAQGGGTGFSATNSTGVITGKVMTGNRIALFQSFSVLDTVQATPFVPASMFGATQT